MKPFLLGLSLLIISNTAFAHPEMTRFSLHHLVLHIASSIGITALAILLGYLFFNYLPKLRTQVIRIKETQNRS